MSESRDTRGLFVVFGRKLAGKRDAHAQYSLDGTLHLARGTQKSKGFMWVVDQTPL